MPKTILVSNRLPVTINDRDGDAVFERSLGGLATGLAHLHERPGSDSVWVGWPGSELAALPSAQRAQLVDKLRAARIVPVEVPASVASRSYDGFANGVLWPLFHSLLSDLPLRQQGFEEYLHVNERFADRVIEIYRPGDTIWIHDFHLLVLPAMLRDRLRDARIGIFLHVPFPPTETFRALPHRQQVLEGMLGADLIGFHTPSYARHFASAAMSLLGADVDVDRLHMDGREVRLGAFPMGVDAAAFDVLGRDADVVAEAQKLREDGCRLLVGVDRLDYTKGIPRRLLAFEELLKTRPELRGRVRLIQVAVPSRMHGHTYKDYREHVEALVGRINGELTTPSWAPVRLVMRALSQREVATLYRAADVMLVTPIRDGMNLVAKEFVATRADEDGVLILSELCGAAAELAEAVHVNPYDVESAAAATAGALEMDSRERHTRMCALRKRVRAYDAERWCSAFLDELAVAPAVDADVAASSAEIMASVIKRMRAAEPLVLLLDYDGTLVPYATSPHLAPPDESLFELLLKLSARPKTSVHIVSGRPREDLDAYFGGLKLTLHAEHGGWSRVPGEEWKSRSGGLPARDRMLAILRDYAVRTPGAAVEEKSTTLAWHWRGADPVYGRRQASELRAHLHDVLSNVPVAVIAGDRVVEVRREDVSKKRVAVEVAWGVPVTGVVVACGDDGLDEELFAGLPEGGVSIHVGDARSRANVRVGDVEQMRALLLSICEE